MKEFLKLDNKLILKLRIVPDAPLLIVDSRAMEKLQQGEKNKLLFLRNNKGQLYIPGSTLKGLFRERFYQIYESKGTLENLGNLFGETEEEGEKGLKAKIFFQDAFLINEETENSVKLRNITPLDPASNKPATILNFEYTEEPFITEIILNNATTSDIQNLYFVIRDSLDGNIQVGHSKTRGFGFVHFEIEDFIFEKYHGKKMIAHEKFFTRDEKLSQKLGNTYLKETLFLKPEYKEVDMKNLNEFIKTLFSEVK